MATPPPSPQKPLRENREFRIMYRSTSTSSGHEEKNNAAKKGGIRRKVSRMFGHGLSSVPLVDELSTYLAGKAGHWALVVLKPTPPPVLTADSPRQIRPAIKPDDPRIQRVFELRRKSGSGSNPPEETSRPKTPDDSDQEDRHEDDQGFPDANKAGANLKMQVSEKLRSNFAELKYDHIGGVCWEILTGIEARTKFTNSELRHEANMEAAAKLPAFEQQLPEFLRLAGDNYQGEKPLIVESTPWPDSEGAD